MTVNIRIRLSIIIFSLLFIMRLYSVDCQFQIHADCGGDKPGGGVSVLIEEETQDNLSIDGALLYKGNNQYDAQCMFYYQIPFIRAGGGLVYSVTNSGIIPGLSLGLSTDSSKIISADLSTTLCLNPQNLAELYSYNIDSTLNIKSQNAIASFNYILKNTTANAEIKHIGEIAITAYQEGIPFQANVLFNSSFCYKEKLQIVASVGGGANLQTKNGIKYFLNGLYYLLGDEYESLPNFSISGGFRISIE